MQALSYEAPQQLRCVEQAIPQAGAGEVLIKVMAVGICGSDMHAYAGHDERRPPPLILGHEAAGVVIGGDWDGRRVSVNPLVSCGECAFCSSGRDNLCTRRQIISMPPRAGAFAQYLTMPRHNLVPVPDDFPLSKACLVEPMACGWHAVRVAQRVSVPASSALVLGGGAIGVGAALALRARGVDNITLVEINAPRRAYLSARLNCKIIDSSAIDAAEQFDLIVDGVGIDASRALASKHATPGGVIAHIGLGSASGGLDIRRMTLQEIAFIGTYTYSSKDFHDCARAMFAGALGAIDWWESYPLSDGATAFAQLAAGKVPAAKIVLLPWEVSEHSTTI